MNRIYRLVWNQVTNLWVCCAENAKGRGKSSGVCRSGSCRSGCNPTLLNDVGLQPDLRKTVLAVSLALIGTTAFAAPTGGQISTGSGSIAQSGSATTITQTTQNLAINWQSFGSAANESITFAQPNAAAIALNRVTGQNPSSLLGSLNANGQVFILNPNGVLFGAGSQVNVGGLVASTLSLSDADFMAGKNTFSGTSGSVVNQGTLTAAQAGYIALLAPEVRNEGVISATLGTAVLAAGNKITLNLNNGSLVNYTIDQGALNALADNKQLIQADGGQVFMSAKAADALATAVVNNTGIIQARTIQNKAGKIILLGDMQYGTVNVGGTLDASAPSPSASLLPLPLAGEGQGRGGFIETSAAHVHIADSTSITTAAANGLSGTWLIDPVDFTIAATGGDITGATLTTQLAAGNVTIQSTLGASGTAGDVNVNDAVSWSANLLTLNAQNNININAVMDATASASLALQYGQGAVAAGNTSNIITGVAGAVNLPAGTNNFTTLQGSDGVVKNYTVITALGAAGSVTTTDLQGMSGNVTLNYALGANIDACLTGGNCTSGATAAWNAGAGFAPVGIWGASFTGTFDGLGHTISNLTINRTTNAIGLFGYGFTTSVIRNVGLVGGSVAGGTANNVGGLVGNSQGTISNSYAMGSVSSTTGANVGGLVGINSGTVSNSYATGSVSSTTGYYVGGLVGYGQGTISNSYATGSVSSTSGYYVGGMVGYNRYGTISNSYATGSVSSTTGAAVGGLVGYQLAGTISNSYATGNVSGISAVGGLVGYGNGTISNSYATGNVSSTSGSNVGGLVGYNFAGTVSNSFYDIDAGTINGARSVTAYGLYTAQFTDWKTHGFALNPVTYFGTATAANTYTVTGVQGLKDLLGFSSNAALTFNLAGNIDLTATPLPTGFYLPTWAGTFDGTGKTISNFTLNRSANNTGLFGQTLTGSTIKNLGLTNVSVSGGAGNNVGGLVGYGRGTISNSYATGNVSSTTGRDVGGLVGYEYGGSISNSYATGSVSSTTGREVGGLVGYNSYGTISNSYATGNVNSTSGREVGGLVGGNDFGTISNSYATGNVNSTSGRDVGGLVGWNNYGTISNSYATGLVTGTSNVGGLAGVMNGGTLTANFWDVTTSGKADGLGVGKIGAVVGVAGTPQTGVTGLTTTQMHAQASFTPVGTAAGQWNFTPNTGTWVIFEGQSNPLLRSFMTPLTITANNASKTYDGLAYNGSAGVTYSVTPNMTNLLGTLSYTGGTSAGNYTLTPGGQYSNQQGYLISYATGTLTVNKANLAVTGLSASNKVYDATTAATLTGAIVTAFGTDVVTLSGGTGVFANANVGTAKAVSVSGYTLSGAAAGNYMLVQPSGLTANITAANLSVTGLTVSNKVYDTTTAATLTGTAIVSALGTDVVTLGGTGSGVFANANVGTAKAVTVSGYTLSGAAAGNYTLVQPGGLTANITAANLAVTGVTASNKVYDATTTATLTGTAIVSALGSDVVTLGGTGTGVFANANVGTTKTVSVSGYTLSGAAAGNYTLVQPGGLTADITEVPVAATPVAEAAPTTTPDAAASPAASTETLVVARALAALSGGSNPNLLLAFQAAKAAVPPPVVLASNSFAAPMFTPVALPAAVPVTAAVAAPSTALVSKADALVPQAQPQATGSNQSGGQPAVKAVAQREDTASDSSPATSTQPGAQKPVVVAQVEPVTVQQIGMVSVRGGGIKPPENEMTSLRDGTVVSQPGGTGTTSSGTKSEVENKEQ